MNRANDNQAKISIAQLISEIDAQSSSDQMKLRSNSMELPAPKLSSDSLKGQPLEDMQLNEQRDFFVKKSKKLHIGLSILLSIGRTIGLCLLGLFFGVLAGLFLSFPIFFAIEILHLGGFIQKLIAGAAPIRAMDFIPIMLPVGAGIGLVVGLISGITQGILDNADKIAVSFSKRQKSFNSHALEKNKLSEQCLSVPESEGNMTSKMPQGETTGLKQ